MDSTTKEKIIEKAEDLFFSKGFKSTSLQDLAGELDIKPASLYYHFPSGKEEIYIAVLRSRLEKYREQIAQLSNDNNGIDQFLRDFASWFIEQPSMNMELIAELDMPYLTPKSRQVVMGLISNSIFLPLRDVFANSKDDLKDIEPMRLVGLYINLLNGMSYALKKGYTQKAGLVQDYIEILLRGMTRK